MCSMLMRCTLDLDVTSCPDATSAMHALEDPAMHWFRIFLDLDVPGARGLSLVREVQRLGLETRCCVVTALDRADLINEVRTMGFLGYLVKATPYDEFAAFVNQVLAGEHAFPEAGWVKEPTTRLTKKQGQLLDCVRRGMSSKAIANTLFLSEGTINNNINAALKALGVTSRSHAVAKALELGLLTFNPHVID